MATGRRVVKTLEVPSCAESLSEVVLATGTVAAELRLDEAEGEELAIAVTEAVNNAIHHGNGGVRRKPVLIRFEVEGQHLSVRVCDRGAGFDPASVPDPLLEENMLNPSGRGLLVMQSMMDKVWFQFSEDGTEVMLLKRLSRLPSG
ncbi:MAG: ATP-binding protein [Candidatus Latescibacteria bacterium]|nr:ATP-binding protein [Candidatus Latescibacterota bacterium]